MKEIFVAIGIAIVIIGGALMLVYRGGDGVGSDNAGVALANNVSIVDGKQIIEITARGGYQPRHSVAKAGLPTIIRFETSGTFDCSSSVRIPSLNVFKSLPQTGLTDIDAGSPLAGLVRGSCGMGMYPFEVDFQN